MTPVVNIESDTIVWVSPDSKNWHPCVIAASVHTLMLLFDTDPDELTHWNVIFWPTGSVLLFAGAIKVGGEGDASVTVTENVEEFVALPLVSITLK